MIQNLSDFVVDEPIFADANIFLFHAFDDEKHGKAATSFLTRIENEEIEALTSSLVVDEVFFRRFNSAGFEPEQSSQTKEPRP